tara:strand:+ start:1389 stop:1577 length:189 start_codon:yes stop_codon:yes gene_type:complete
MKKHELEEKYGKELIDKIFTGNYLDGCTVVINDDLSEDIPECDIIRVIREINGEKIGAWEWD